MANDTLQGIGPFIKLASGTPPAAVAAGTVTGAAIDRLGFNAMVLEAETGVATGTPTTQTLDTKVTHCDTSGGTYVDWKPDGTAASGAVAQITAVSTRKRKSIDLNGAKRYLKIVTVTAFTGGSSPTLASSVKVILGASDTLVAQADD